MAPEEPEIKVPSMAKPKWYGGCLCLCDEHLEKLELDGDLPEPGEMIHFEAMAKVTHASKGDDGSRVELEITHMGVVGGNEESRGAKWYSHEEPDEDDNE